MYRQVAFNSLGVTKLFRNQLRNINVSVSLLQDVPAPPPAEPVEAPSVQLTGP